MRNAGRPRAAGWPGGSQVHRWAQEAQASCTDPVGRFLLAQFVEYLGWEGLGGFAGFEASDFEAASDEARMAAKSKLRALWDDILDRLSGPERDALGKIHANKISQGEWPRAQSNFGQDSSNLTIALRPEVVEPHLAAWKADPGSAFRRWLDTPTAATTLRGYADYELAIFVRRAHGYDNRAGGANPWWQKSSFQEIETIPTAEIDDAAVARLSTTIDAFDQKWEKPAMNLRRRIPSADAVNAGRGLRPRSTDDIRHLLPLRDEINRLLSRRSPSLDA